MEFHQIKYFLSVAKTLNFTRAAEMCHVSQPALTTAIKKLEEEVGAELIKRDGRNTHLTEVGLVLKKELAAIEAGMKGALEAVQKAKGLEKAVLKVGLMWSIGPQILMTLFKDFKRSFPGVELDLMDIRPDEAEELLLKGKADCALIALHKAAPDTLEAHPLYREQMVVSFAKGHRFEDKKKVRLEDLKGETYIDRLHCEFRDWFFEETGALGLDLEVGYKSEREDWIEALIADNAGVALFPEFSVNRKDLETRPLSKPALSRTVHLLTVKDKPKNKALELFISALKTRAREGFSG